MGTMRFLIPAGLSDEAARELEKTCVAGGQDNMPFPTQVEVTPPQLVVARAVEDSGCLVVPWDVDGFGRLMGCTATLIERHQPYPLSIELARGKVNQLRCQMSDWLMGGLQMPPNVADRVGAATLNFARAIGLLPSDKAAVQAQDALALSYIGAEQLAQVYVSQVFQVRHQRQKRLDTLLSCRLGTTLPADPAGAALVKAVNSVCLPMTWKGVEPSEGNFDWDATDALLDWAQARDLPVTAGPLLDFSAGSLPDWLWLWEQDLPNLAGFMCEYVETAVKRYQGRVQTWQLTRATNHASILALEEDELLWLTVRLAETARQIDPNLDLVVGITQPWGDYMAREDYTRSPFEFADTLIRSGLSLGALDLELVMGTTPRGSYCRDLLEVSRLLDLYALLGMPLQVTLGYPSAAAADPLADSELAVGAGYWRTGYSPAVQADWASAFASLALCKPYVRGLQWTHFSDAEPHQFPHCGLVDAAGNVKPALHALRELREQHLR